MVVVVVAAAGTVVEPTVELTPDTWASCARSNDFNNVPKPYSPNPQSHQLAAQPSPSTPPRRLLLLPPARPKSATEPPESTRASIPFLLLLSHHRHHRQAQRRQIDILQKLSNNHQIDQTVPGGSLLDSDLLAEAQCEEEVGGQLGRLDLATEKMRMGRRSPEMGVEVGFEGAEVEPETKLESREIEGSSSSAL